MAQTKYVGPALLHALERLPVYGLDLPALLTCGDSHTASLEEAIVRIIREAQKKGAALPGAPAPRVR
jgi:hypothetical protein